MFRSLALLQGHGLQTLIPFRLSFPYYDPSCENNKDSCHQAPCLVLDTGGSVEGLYIRYEDDFGNNIKTKISQLPASVRPSAIELTGECRVSNLKIENAWDGIHSSEGVNVGRSIIDSCTLQAMIKFGSYTSISRRHGLGFQGTGLAEQRLSQYKHRLSFGKPIAFRNVRLRGIRMRSCLQHYRGARPRVLGIAIELFWRSVRQRPSV